MTVLESYELLLDFFSANDIFDLEKDYSKLNMITDYDTSTNKAILKSALSMMEKDNMVSNCNNKYVLIKKLVQYRQNVEISALTALSIASIINKYCDTIKNDGARCNPINIQERDLLNLSDLVTILTNKEGENG